MCIKYVINLGVKPPTSEAFLIGVVLITQVFIMIPSKITLIKKIKNRLNNMAALHNQKQPRTFTIYIYVIFKRKKALTDSIIFSEKI